MEFNNSLAHPSFANFFFSEIVASLEYNPFTQEWKVQRSDDKHEETELSAKMASASLEQ